LNRRKMSRLDSGEGVRMFQGHLARILGSVDNYLKCSMIEPNSMYPRKLAAFLS
jgi:hypothetical protein